MPGVIVRSSQTEARKDMQELDPSVRLDVGVGCAIANDNNAAKRSALRGCSEQLAGT